MSAHIVPVRQYNWVDNDWQQPALWAWKGWHNLTTKKYYINSFVFCRLNKPVNDLNKFCCALHKMLHITFTMYSSVLQLIIGFKTCNIITIMLNNCRPNTIPKKITVKPFSEDLQCLRGRMSLIWISKAIISRIEEKAMSLSVFYYCICDFPHCWCSFKPTLCNNHVMII